MGTSPPADRASVGTSDAVEGPGAARTGRSLPGFRLALGLILLALGVTNVVQFGDINDAIHTPRQAFGSHTSLDLPTIAGESARTARERYLVFTQLEELAPGARYEVASGSGLREQFLVGLARAEAVELTPGPPRRLPDEVDRRLDEHVRAEGVLRGVGPYVIALPTTVEGVVTFVTARGEERLVIADARLLTSMEEQRGG
jgi:hypothetical protein